MTRQKDTAVRCVYIALRWSAVASARFSIDILLRWSKETPWSRRAWCVFTWEINKHQHPSYHKVI